jgi:hypothetical protein
MVVDVQHTQQQNYAKSFNYEHDYGNFLPYAVYLKAFIINMFARESFIL